MKAKSEILTRMSKIHLVCHMKAIRCPENAITENEPSQTSMVAS